MSKAFKNAFDKLTHPHGHHSPKERPSTPSAAAASSRYAGESGDANPLGLPHIDTSDSSTTNTSTSTLSHSTGSTAIPSDVNSPAGSGANTPVDERGHHVAHSHLKAATGNSAAAHGHAHGGKQHKEEDISRTGSLNKALSQKCEDLHEHFKAIKLHHNKSADHATSGKDATSHTTSAGHKGTSAHPTRPALNHMKTEEDERALRVERQEELKREQLQREADAKAAYESDPLNGNYGYLNIDATPNAIDTSGRKDTFLEIAKKSEGEDVFFRARIQSLRKQSE